MQDDQFNLRPLGASWLNFLVFLPQQPYTNSVVSTTHFETYYIVKLAPFPKKFGVKIEKIWKNEQKPPPSYLFIPKNELLGSLKITYT